MELFIIRHTPVDLPSGVCYGQYDAPLQANFAEATAQLQQKLPATSSFDQVYSSPLSRCVQLAQTFTKNVTTDANLLEMNFGDWENQAWDAIDPEPLQAWMDNFVQQATPNGESMQQLYERVAIFLEQLRQSTAKRVLVVAHAGSVRCCWAHLLHIPLRHAFKVTVPYGECLEFHLGKEAAFDQLIRKF